MIVPTIEYSCTPVSPKIKLSSLNSSSIQFLFFFVILLLGGGNEGNTSVIIGYEKKSECLSRCRTVRNEGQIGHPVCVIHISTVSQ